MNKVLKLLRVAYELSISEMAEKLGITQSYLSKIEAGINVPSDAILKKYQSIFKIKVSTLKFFGEKKNNEEVNTQELFLMLLRTICGLKDERVWLFYWLSKIETI